MNYMEAEELAMHIVGLDEDTVNDADLDEAIYAKFEVNMEQFHSIAKAKLSKPLGNQND